MLHFWLSHSLLESAHSFSSVSISVFIGRFFLIADGVLKACPEVHSDCTELYLHRYMDLFFRKEYRQPDRQVQTAVAVGLWVGNVVLLCDYLNIRLIF